MKRYLNIGLTYDVKEDYGFQSNSWKHVDFSTLAEVNYVKELFEARGHTVHLIGNYNKLNDMLKSSTLPRIDMVFNTAEGIHSRNREGWIPSLLEINHIPYSGSDAYGLSISLNKLHTKIFAKYLNITTPNYFFISSTQDAIEAANNITAPWILKPNYEGSSSGVVHIDNVNSLKIEVDRLLNEYHQSILCETYIPGREFNVSLLYDGKKTEVIGTVEVVRKDGSPINIFDARDKFTGTCTKIPAELPPHIINQMCDNAVKLHRFIGCCDYNRADFRLANDGTVYFLELNPLPSIDDESGFAMCCSYNNIKLGDVLEKIVLNALERFNSKNIQI